MSETKDRNPRISHWRQYGRQLFWPIFWAFAISFAIIFIINQSQEFSNCVHEGKKTEKYKSLNERSSDFIHSVEINRLRVNLYSRCIGHFIDKNDSVLTALATIALGIFTYTLWRATARLGDLATSQASDMQELLTAARNNASAAANQAETAAQQHAALREQARATADVVAATKAANDLTNRIFFADQRPWVSIQEISISPTANKGEWEFEVVVSNTGGSPAHYV